jgi:uncharacterized membrane protein
VAQRTILLVFCCVIFLVSIPLALRLVPPNRIYGFRTRKTLSRPDIWYRANVFSAYSLMLSTAVKALIISCAPQFSDVTCAFILAALILCATAASFVYLRRIA